MARSFNDLPRFIRGMAGRVDAASNKLVKAASKAAGRRAVETTRVDTGKARSNWRAKLNGPAAGVISAYAPGNKLGIGERANATAAIAQQNSVIRTFSVRKHQSVYISNGVSYIGFLNDGTPKISAGQMAQQAVQAARVAITSEKVLNTLVPKGGTGTFS